MAKKTGPQNGPRPTCERYPRLDAAALASAIDDRMLESERPKPVPRVSRAQQIIRKPIMRDQLERLSPFIEQELRKLALVGAVSPPAALRQIFIALYGNRHRSPQERRLFLSVTAASARRVAIETAPAGERMEACEISVADFGTWLARLDSIDRTTTRVIDLYCFAGASLKETAAVTGLSIQVVTSALRAAFATLKSRANRVEAMVAERESRPEEQRQRDSRR